MSTPTQQDIDLFIRLRAPLLNLEQGAQLIADHYAELRKDKERLDWLEARTDTWIIKYSPESCYIEEPHYVDMSDTVSNGPTLRAAIDAAKEAK